MNKLERKALVELAKKLDGQEMFSTEEADALALTVIRMDEWIDKLEEQLS